MRASVYIATSLDGFIARTDGSIDWLPKFGTTGEDYGFHTFMDSIDALVMGRKTFEKVLTFGVNWPYPKPGIIVSTAPVKIPADMADRVEWVGETIQDVLQGMIQRKYDHVYLDGAQTIQSFLKLDLVDRFIITVIPVLIGTGIPLFGPVNQDVQLKLVDSKHWPSGLTQHSYDVIKSDPGAG